MDKKILSEIEDLLQQHGQYAQGIRALGVTGRRDSDYRFEIYHLNKYLTKRMSVLDIGSNCGFLSCLIAAKVDSLYGIDIDERLVKIASLAAKAFDLQNCKFEKKDFKTIDCGERFDFIVASQIHYWVQMPFALYIKKLHTLLNAGGYLLFESHDIETVDKDIDSKMQLIKDKGFTVEHLGEWIETPGIYMIPPTNHKDIPRRFFILKKEDSA